MNHKRSVILIVTIAIGLHLGLRLISSQKSINYLYINQFGLETHLLTTDQTQKEKILFLGSSAVAGSNIPQQTTLTDYFNQQNANYQAYNLASFQSNLLDANVLLSIYKTKFPKIAILGIDPTMFLKNQLSLFSKFHAKEAGPILKTNLKNELLISPKDQFEILIFNSPPTPPHSLLIWWKSYLAKLRNLFWGPLFDKKVFSIKENILDEVNDEKNKSWILIDTFIDIAKKNNIAPIIFITPVLENAYPKKEFFIFKQKIKEKSNLLNFYLKDYSSAFSSSHDFFYDFNHLTPDGYKELALKLRNDLIRDNIITEKAK